MNILSYLEYPVILIFLIPGFITIWSFQYFFEVEEKTFLETLGFSFFFGIILLLISQHYFEAPLRNELYNELFIRLSGIGLTFGLISGKSLKNSTILKILNKDLHWKYTN